MPVRILATEGARADCKEGVHLIQGLSAQAFLADRGYDAQEMIDRALRSGMAAVIPPKRNRKEHRFVSCRCPNPMFCYLVCVFGLILCRHDLIFWLIIHPNCDGELRIRCNECAAAGHRINQPFLFAEAIRSCDRGEIDVSQMGRFSLRRQTGSGGQKAACNILLQFLRKRRIDRPF